MMHGQHFVYALYMTVSACPTPDALHGFRQRAFTDQETLGFIGQQCCSSSQDDSDQD